MQEIIFLINLYRYTIGEIIWVLLLGVCAWKDVRTQTLPIKTILVGGCLMLPLLVIESPEMWLLSLRILPGVLLLLIGFFSKEQIGYGDGICVMMSGMIFSLRMVWLAIMFSFALLILMSIFLLFIKKARRDLRIPYIPFLLVGTLLGMWVQAG